MKRWERAEKLWADLVAVHGPPTPTDTLSTAELDAALAADRVIAVGVMRDGFGGGSVGFDRAAGFDRAVLEAGSFRHNEWAWTVFWVLGDHRLTDRQLEILRGNAWESTGDIG